VASVSKHLGAYRVQVVLENKRYDIRLPGIDQRTAEAFARHVDALNAARLAGAAPRADTAAWVGSLPDETHAKLSKIGLAEPRVPIEPPEEICIERLVADYISKRPDVKPSTLRIWRQTERLLRSHFGRRLVNTITPLDAKAFHAWLCSQGFAAASVSKYTSFARQFFTAAVDAELIAGNPFAKIRLGNRKNPSRQRFIDMNTFRKVVDGTRDPVFRLVLMLSRIGGLRIPSELRGLKWAHIDWEAGRILVHSPKTARYPGGESREIPIFPELVPYLQAVWEKHGEEHEYVIPTNRASESAWRVRLAKLLDRLGISKWPRVFHNLRSSRQTELQELHPVHVVCKWLGNSPEVARDHYLQVRESDFEKAREILPQILPQQVQERCGNDRKLTALGRLENREKPCFSGEKRGFERERMGIENTALLPGKGTSSSALTAVLTALEADPSLAELVERLVAVWSRLSASERTKVAAAIPHGR
jgi:integrase